MEWDVLITKLRTHASSARRIGNEAEADAFDAKADKLERLYPHPLGALDKADQELVETLLKLQQQTRDEMKKSQERLDELFRRIDEENKDIPALLATLAPKRKKRVRRQA